MIKLSKLGTEILLTTCLFTMNPVTVFAEENELISEEYEDIVIDNNLLPEDIIDDNSIITEDVIDNSIVIEETENVVDDSLYVIYFNTVSSYYGLNCELVSELAKSVTNGYIYNVGLDSDINDAYAFCLEFVHKLYTNPEYFSVELRDYKATTSINNNLDAIDFEGFTSDICESINVDYRLAKAISDYETGYQSSYQAICKNNFGGLKGNSGYMTFPSAEAGIISYLFYIKKLNGSKGIENIESLSGIYVNGNRSKPDKKWINSVSYIYKNIENSQSKKLLFELD